MNLRKFQKWALEDRAGLVKKLLDGEDIDRKDVFLGFTRHTPTIITNGPAGINGSVKGIGFIPKPEYIENILETYLEHISSAYDETYSHRGLKILWEHMFSQLDRLDVLHMASIELAKRNTWANLNDNSESSLIFYQPPVISYELKAEIKIHTDGIIHQFVNAQHDIYHKPNMNAWQKRPVYEIIVKEIYDKSATPEGFGKRIYP